MGTEGRVVGQSSLVDFERCHSHCCVGAARGSTAVAAVVVTNAVVERCLCSIGSVRFLLHYYYFFFECFNRCLSPSYSSFLFGSKHDLSSGICEEHDCHLLSHMKHYSLLTGRDGEIDMAVYLACLAILSEKTMQTTTILRTGRCIGVAQERKSLWSENHLPLQSSQLKSLYLPVSLSHRLEVRAQVAQAFLGKFQLSSEEMATLRGARDSAITEVITSIMRFNEKNRSASSTAASVRGLVVCGSSVSILWLRGWWMMSLCQRVILAGDE